MNIKMTLYTPEEFDAAAVFCAALAAARRDTKQRPFGFGLEALAESVWRNRPVAEEPPARTVVVDEPESVETETAEAPEPVAEAQPTEQPKKRVRSRKEPAPEMAADHAVLGEDRAAASGQIDLEDVIAAQTESVDNTPSANQVSLGALELDDTDIDEAPQPEDPEAGWTTQDARNAGKALLDRAPDVESGNRRLAAVLETFGVKQVKALSPDQIEAFVIATTKAVF